MPDNGSSFDTTLRLSARQVFESPETAQGVTQDAEDSVSESVWTIQRFAEVSGKSWFALQQQAPDGSIQRQYTGFGEEVAELAARMNVTPRVLPAISEEQFYAQLMNDSRDYELGRQFGADQSAGIPHHLAPIDLDRFSNGLTDREFEQEIRVENEQPAPQGERFDTSLLMQMETATANENTPRAAHLQRDQHQQQQEETAAQSFGMRL